MNRIQIRNSLLNGVSEVFVLKIVFLGFYSEHISIIWKYLGLLLEVFKSSDANSFLGKLM